MATEDRKHVSRRAWITTTTGVVAAGLIKTQADAVRLVAQEAPSASDPTRVPGRLVSELGTRAAAERPRRLVRSPALSSSSRTPLQDLYGIITPADLQQTFGFPGGNIEHTMLVAGQCYFDRNYASNPNQRFYRFGEFDNLSICGSSTYPCGSVAGTPAYMCVKELLPRLR